MTVTAQPPLSNALDGSRRQLYYCRSRKALMAFVSPSGWIENGKRVAADSRQARQEMINLWPLPLKTLAAIRTSRCALTTGLDDLPPYGHDAQLPLQLTGVRDGAIIKPAQRKQLSVAIKWRGR
ncbi:hypothetical protein ACNKHP_05910 [Shigella boydii]